jgi:RNA 2',3'-cyclic 3'-phosphodiesterase
MPRLFVAIDLPETLKDGLLALQRDDIPTARWPEYEAWHLTLHFIGNVPEGVAKAYERVLKKVDVPAFDLKIGGVGQFPIEQRPKVIWAGVDNTPELRALYEAAGEALEDEKFIREERRFHPHISLMRFRKPIRRGVSSTWINEHIDWHIDPAKISEFALYESNLIASEAVYTKRQTYSLTE